MATPMQRQYNSLKKQYDDCLLLFRLGDFYECFNNDAKIISKVLGITLTSRGKKDNKHPMAGIPHHALDNYLHKLVNAGYKVAIAEQMEEPQKGKKIVERDVVKIVSSGTITSDKSLEENKNNYIAAIATGGNVQKGYTHGLAVCDLTTGEFYLTEFAAEQEDHLDTVVSELRRTGVIELLTQRKHLANLQRIDPRIRLQVIDDSEFSISEKKDLLKKHFGVRSLRGFGLEGITWGMVAAGVILQYLIDTQKSSLEHINSISYKHLGKYMRLDEHTIRSLELIEPLRNDNTATLLSVLDECETAMGKRKLYNWILFPLLEKKAINKRLDAVEKFYSDSPLLREVRGILNNIYDIERIVGKIGTETVNARDLLALRDSLQEVKRLEMSTRASQSGLIDDLHTAFDQADLEKVIELIEMSIQDEPAATITEGGIIKDGYSKELDDLRTAARGGKKWLNELQLQEQKRTGIPSLKVKFNKVFGFYIEVSKSNLSKVPDNYVRKQTLVNAERYITPELKEKEDLILNAEENAIELEYRLFTKIRSDIAQFSKVLQSVAEGIAILDCIVNFAHIAQERGYTKPSVVTSASRKLEMNDSRHPVVEFVGEDAFIPNDVHLDTKKRQIAIITGPNMAGKSTYIRQVALCVLVAQIGSYVPASSMVFSPIDRIFTRVGASDNLAAGQSTFLVEMSETANILNNATNNSLIILDEVGRGTSTYDGVAIAWAVAEYIHEQIGAKTLFATHYHELIELKRYLPRIFNLNVAVNESDGEITFIRKIQKGGTDKSYGVHVAKYAGIPEEVIDKANDILMGLEQEGMFEVKHIESELSEQTQKEKSQLTLLASLPENPAVDELRKIDINTLTPLEAQKHLDRLIRLANAKRP